MSSKSYSSSDLAALAGRLEKSGLSGDDQAVLKELLEQAVALRKLMENATETSGGKKVLASLPFGFDLVK